MSKPDHPPSLFGKHVFIVTQKTLFWTALVSLIVVNTLLTQPAIRIRLAQIALRIPLQSGENSTSILGAETEKTGTQLHYEALTKEYEYWQTITTLHPDYRDGFYKLALVAYELGKFSEVNTYLAKVQSIDPNYPGIEKLRALLPQK